MKYYLDRRADGQGLHQIHREDCPYLPERSDLIPLGDYPDCHGPLMKSMAAHYAASDGCAHCSMTCHLGPVATATPEQVLYPD